MVYNIEKSKEELVNNFKCFYAPTEESICIIIESEIRYFNLTRDIVMNLMAFAKKIDAKNLLLLLDKKNSDYGKELLLNIS